MNKQKIEACERLCREFIKRVGKLKNRAESEQTYHNAMSVMDEKPAKQHTFEYLTEGTRESAALRRTSMELTRALADMRKPG